MIPFDHLINSGHEFPLELVIKGSESGLEAALEAEPDSLQSLLRMSHDVLDEVADLALRTGPVGLVSAQQPVVHRESEGDPVLPHGLDRVSGVAGHFEPSGHVGCQADLESHAAVLNCSQQVRRCRSAKKREKMH